MNENKLAIGLVVGLVLGVVVSLLVTNSAVNNQGFGMMWNMMGGGGNMMSNHAAHHPEQVMFGMMDDMMSGQDGRTGDEFDKAFLAGMIVHHEGAINMANAALRNAKHQEIKNMANEIISTQSKEIEQMNNWEKQWYNK